MVERGFTNLTAVEFHSVLSHSVTDEQEEIFGFGLGKKRERIEQQSCRNDK